MNFFFFGTLMDREILERVLARPVAPEALVGARLTGYCRVKALHASYPVLVAAPGASLRGVVLLAATPRDVRRISHFEDEEYAAAPCRVTADGLGALDAAVFMALAALPPTQSAWHFEDWAREHKAAYLRQCDVWMQDCPE